MTLPAAPNPISLNQIKTEFGPSRGYSNAISHYRNAVLGRPSGAVSFSEFRGLSAILVYDLTFPPYPTYSTLDFAFSTPHGPFYWSASSHERRAINTQRLILSNNMAHGGTPATAAWGKFLRTEITFAGYTWDKATWEANSGDIAWSPGNFGGGAMKFYFNG